MKTTTRTRETQEQQSTTRHEQGRPDDGRKPRLFAAQRDAAAQVRAHYLAALHGGRVAGFGIRPASLLLGPSGTGKSFIARAVAGWQKTPLFETSLGAWVPTSAKGHPTIEAYVELVRRQADFLRQQKGKIIVFIDEIDKLSQQASDNSNWCSFVWTEVMRLMDGRLEEFGVDPGLARHARSGTYFICAGAFQQLWEQETGTVGFVEELETARMDFSTIARAGILPRELLNRAGGLTVFVAPPRVDEIAGRLRQIEEHFRIQRSAGDLERDARRILTGGQFARGLEEHFTRLACRRFLPPDLVDTPVKLRAAETSPAEEILPAEDEAAW
jgi:hypothetical protein